MADVIPLADLPLPSVLQILQKTAPVSFARLRRTCKWLDTVAEKNRKYIGVLLYRINIIPVNKPIEYQHTFSFATPDEAHFQIWKSKNLKEVTCMSLPEACKQLSGFTFSQVTTEPTAFPFSGYPYVTTPKFSPNVHSAYIDFLRQQRWLSKAAVHTTFLFNLPEIFNIIKPKILKILGYDLFLYGIPKSAKTLELACIPYVRHIPRHIENLIVNYWELYLPLDPFIRDIVEAFRDDDLPVSYIQLKNESETMLLRNTDPNDSKAATKLLARYLKETPYNDNETYDSHAAYHTEDDHVRTINIVYFNIQNVTAANVMLTSKKGSQGLLAVRVDMISKRVNRKNEVSVYFWKDRHTMMEATRECYEEQGTGIVARYYNHSEYCYYKSVLNYSKVPTRYGLY